MRNFFGSIWKMIRRFFMTIGIVVTIGYVFLIFFLSSYKPGEKKPEIDKPTKPFVIYSQPRGVLTTELLSIKQEILENFFQQTRSLPMTDFKKVFEKAIDDKLVKGVFLDISLLQGSLSHFGYLSTLIADFRKASNKPIWVHSSNLNTNNYLAASQATNLSLTPIGGVELVGPAFQLMYFADAAKKIGVKFNVFRAGKYKSAFESLVENNPSPATLEEMRSLEESIRQYFISRIAGGRGVDPGNAATWMRQSYFTSDEAAAKNMVNSVQHSDTALAEFKKSLGLEKKDSMTLLDYFYSIEKEKAGGNEGIALIQASGSIYMDAEDGDDSLIPRRMIKRLRWALEEDDIKSVVLRVDSPGGSALASEVIWRDVVKLVAKKPVVISMGSVAASGGYYIAAPATKIYAEPTTITGSIGVIGMIPSFADFKQKYGIHFHMLTQSDRRALLNLGEEPSVEDTEILGRSIDDVYNTFLQRVADGRNKTPEQVHALAQGRVYTGPQAKDVGLVDEIGGLYDAIQDAKELGGLNPQKLYKLHVYQDDKLSIWDCLNVKNIAKCANKFGVTYRSHAKAQNIQSYVPRGLSSSFKDLVDLSANRDFVQAKWFGPRL